MTRRIEGFEIIEIAAQRAQLVERDFQILCEFLFCGRAAEVGRERGGRGVEFACLAPETTSARVEGAKTVEDGAANAELGIGRELEAFLRREAVNGIEEAERSGADQVVEFDMGGKAGAHLRGDGADEREVLLGQRIAIGAGEMVPGGAEPGWVFWARVDTCGVRGERRRRCFFDCERMRHSDGSLVNEELKDGFVFREAELAAEVFNQRAQNRVR